MTFPWLSPAVLLAAMSAALAVAAPQGQPLPRGQKWVASWAASAHGPYSSGNASAQPVLDFAFESAERGAADQTFRLILRPDLWGSRVRTAGGPGDRLHPNRAGSQAMAAAIDLAALVAPKTRPRGQRNSGQR